MNALRRWLEKGSHGYRVASRFFVDLQDYRGKIVGIFLLALVLAGFEVLRPWTIQWVIDYAFAGKSMKLQLGDWTLLKMQPAQIIWLSGGTLILISVGSALLGYAKEVLLSTTSSGVTRAMRYRIFAHMTRLSPGFHARHKSGDLLVRLMGDASLVTGMLVDTALDVMQRSLVVIATVGIMLLKDWRLTLAMGASIPILMLFVRLISVRIRTATRKAREKEGDLADYLHEAIAATETIQSMGGGEQVVRRFARSNRSSARADVKAGRLAARLSGLVESTLGTTAAIVMVFAAYRVLHATDLARASGLANADPADYGMTIGTFTVFFTYVRSLLKPLRASSKNAARFSKGTACGERVLAVLDATDLVESKVGAPPAPEVPHELAFEDVSYAYKEGADALSGFSATFKRGQLSALVGRSGAGKSTIAALALRLFDPSRGAVRLDGQSLRDLDLASLRARMGLAQQRTVFFGESLRENMLLASPEATDEAIWAALEQAGAASFVASQPEKLDAKLGSNGVGLSGGQQSRLSLARTLLRRAPVLIVDEPFAGLDLAAAKRVADTLQRLAQERILVVIAHDLERLDAYDHIVFLENGTKVAEGRHEELLRDVPLYREVVRTSAGVRG
ncbi:MAG: ABC transporter ATP-binding protein [Planctomycetes bacterium]|nr:ABC transporter ATP-binding protein [Planctomycetota bacterium]